MLQSGTQTNLAYSKTEPIVSQKDSAESIAVGLLAVWVKVRIEIMQMHPTTVPSGSTEELGLIGRLMRQYGTLSPADFAECIRLAAIDKQRDLSQGLANFPTLYAADFEEQIQKMTLARMKAKPEPLQLAQNTGGNQFWGEPSEALDREWPKIVRQTQIVRKNINPKLRDRFWYGGSAEQRECAVKMLRQMVQEMMDAGKWDLKQNQWEALAIWQSEFCREFPTYGGMVDNMKCPICPIEVGEIKQRLSRIAITQGEFPDIDDSRYCAVFDAYWKFTEADSMVFDDLEV